MLIVAPERRTRQGDQADRNDDSEPCRPVIYTKRYPMPLKTIEQYNEAKTGTYEQIEGDNG